MLLNFLNVAPLGIINRWLDYKKTTEYIVVLSINRDTILPHQKNPGNDLDKRSVNPCCSYLNRGAFQCMLFWLPDGNQYLLVSGLLVKWDMLHVSASWRTLHVPASRHTMTSYNNPQLTLFEASLLSGTGYTWTDYTWRIRRLDSPPRTSSWESVLLFTILLTITRLYQDLLRNVYK